jgi:hypothetical protein
MILKDKINRIYPSVNTECLPNEISTVLKKQLEVELNQRATPEGLQKVKNLVETEFNLLKNYA